MSSILSAGSIPVIHVILYKHGIGFFGREDIEETGEEMRLDFRATDMNDI
ncbi:MAG: hypothetical protein JO185_07415 [Acidobacteriaceae bacterium]|nr:hypothetical protein [Acidobacteriaceae bacterium]